MASSDARTARANGRPNTDRPDTDRDASDRDDQGAASRRTVASLWAAVRRILALSWPYRRRLAVALVLTALGSVVGLVVPLGLRELLDAVFQDANRALLDRLTLALMALFLLQAAVSFAGTYLLEWTDSRDGEREGANER